MRSSAAFAAQPGGALAPRRAPAPAAPPPPGGSRRRRPRAAAAAGGEPLPGGREDLEAQLEAFMARQAEVESGAARRADGAPPGAVLGADEVSEDDARALARRVVRVLKALKAGRDMTVAEVRLTVAIEDPRARERRRMGMEDASGVSRDEMAAALTEVAEGRLPADRIALRELARELEAWPFLDQIEAAAAEGAGAAAGGAGQPSLAAAEASAYAAAAAAPEVRPPVGRDPTEARASALDALPDWVGYGALYLVSAGPVLIVAGVVAVLFFNSLK